MGTPGLACELFFSPPPILLFTATGPRLDAPQLRAYAAPRSHLNPFWGVGFNLKRGGAVRARAAGLLLRRSRCPRSGNFALTMFSTFDELDGRLNCARISPVGLRERLYLCFERPDERKELERGSWKPLVWGRQRAPTRRPPVARQFGL